MEPTREEPSVSPMEASKRPIEEEDNIVVTVRENAVRRVAEEDIDMELYDPMRDL